VVENLPSLAGVETHHVEIRVARPDAEPADFHCAALFSVLGLYGFKLLLGGETHEGE